jgi:hypothetical protein
MVATALPAMRGALNMTDEQVTLHTVRVLWAEKSTPDSSSVLFN